jgi:hypothetical protein
VTPGVENALSHHVMYSYISNDVVDISFLILLRFPKKTTIHQILHK